MRSFANLLVELRGDTFGDGEIARAREQLAARGFEIEETGERDDALAAWIDDSFGGGWSAEAYRGKNLVLSLAGSRVGFVTTEARGLRYAWLRGEATRAGSGLFGPFGIGSDYRGQGLGSALALLACARLRALGYERTVIPAVGEERLERFYSRAIGARVVERIDERRWSEPRARVVAMASGNGSNLQALFDAIASGEMPIEIVAVLSNRSASHALVRAREANVSNVIEAVWDRRNESREAYDRRLLDIVAQFAPEGVLLLGWMHLLGAPFVEHFPELLNLHPAYLPHDPSANEVTLPDGSVQPAFRGAHAVRDALAVGSRWVGASVHRVTAATDRGEVLVRRALECTAARTEDSVFAALRPIEHRVTVEATRLWCYMRPTISVV
ncbi:MAG TPA: GNAT family N-acetyltransferase [Candidatus Dormibacteraeota bacterium]|nr:GNAT family N-acetyltransferase [Candidatus Dormibacteraeota bacterium]